MISDGMSLGVPSLAEPFSRQVRDRGTTIEAMLRDPSIVRTMLRTDSADSMVTDSAAAVSALSGGRRVNNRVLNVTPGGEPVTPLASPLGESGLRIGLVTTDQLCGATPAGFAAVAENREQYFEIAPQLVEGVDILLGGGREHFDPLARPDGRDLFAEARSRGMQFFAERDDLLSSLGPERVIGFFADGKLPYTFDHRGDEQLRRKVPTLAEMSQCALSGLADRAEGFFLMVEGARVDHAAHANDAAGLLWDQLAFDDAVALVKSWAADRDDTLLIVTTDHGNANPGLNGVGAGYRQTSEAFAQVAQAEASFQKLEPALREAASSQTAASSLQRLIREQLGARADENALNVLTRTLNREPGFRDVDRFDRSWVAQLGQIMGNHHGVGWTSANHTADLVLCLATGPGAERLQPAMHHVDLNARLRELMNLPVDAAVAMS